MSNKPKIITLRIQKKYFDRIVAGEKKCEYRDARPYYDYLFQEPVDYLKLHYQGKEKLIIKVEKIEKIPTPEHLQNSNIKFGSSVYAIHLGDIEVITKDGHPHSDYS